MRKKLVAVVVSLQLIFTPAFGLHSLEKYATAKQLASPGLLIIDPTDGRVVVQNSADSLRIPASVLKLVSATAALHYVGPEKQYVTRIFKTANPGEFVIKGELDPWLTSNLSFAKKNKQRFLPTLIAKANTENKSKLKIYYSGLYERDTIDLAVNQKQKGIKLTFEKVDAARAQELAVEEVAKQSSVPMSEMIKFAILWSDNRLADRLAKDAAREIGYPTTGKGLTTTFKQALNELGINHTGLQVKDGSGLSKENRVSAATVVDLLVKTRNNPIFAAIYEGLPIGGQTGTLQKRFLETAPEAVGHVHAKTGWVNSSVTMAGYVEEGDKEYVFAILADGITPTFSSRNKARAAMDRLLGVIVKGNH